MVESGIIDPTKVVEFVERRLRGRHDAHHRVRHLRDSEEKRRPCPAPARLEWTCTKKREFLYRAGRETHAFLFSLFYGKGLLRTPGRFVLLF